MKIVIDAGHGGKDSGAVGTIATNAVLTDLPADYTGKLLSDTLMVKESDLNLSMANSLADKLMAAGHDVYLTRTMDVYVGLLDRCKSANELNADFFISIHVNSADSSKATGIETLVYTKPSNTTLRYVQQSLIKSTQARDRGIKYRGDLTVLKATRMPAILVETGFISNPSDLKKLLTDTYQFAITSAIAEVFLDS